MRSAPACIAVSSLQLCCNHCCCLVTFMRMDSHYDLTAHVLLDSEQTVSLTNAL